MSLTTTQSELAAQAELYARLEHEDYAKCEASLYHFVRAAWDVVEPGVRFSASFHHRAMCAALEAVTEGRITRLCIGVPPGSSKSTICSVLWPVWTWIRRPGTRWLTGSHKHTLAARDAIRSRRVIASPWFQRAWGDRFKLAADMNRSDRYENDKTGYRIAFGMEGGATGERADVLSLDDPHSATDAMFSKAAREAVLEKFDQELSNRLNDPKRSAIVLTMQRLHPRDLVGHVLERGGYVSLRVPMRYEPADACVIPELRWRDPRREPGQLMWPDRYDETYVREQEKVLGSFGAAAQLQMRPVPLEGGMLNPAWFRRYRVLPSKDQWIDVVISIDTAQKADELVNAPWVATTWIRTSTGYFLCKVLRNWFNYPAGKRAIISEWEWCCENLAPPNAILIEAKSTGASLLQELGETTTMPLLSIEPEKDKITRLGIESPTVEAGNVFIPETAPWLNDFITEVTNFPVSDYADQVDSMSQALRFFREGGAEAGPRLRSL